MSEPTNPECAADYFDCRPPIVRTIAGDPTYAYRPMMSFDQRFPPIRRKKVERESQRRFAPERDNQPESTYTYLMGIEGSNHVKIGWAKEPKKRVAYLQTGSPMTISLLWSTEGPYEALLHKEFASCRVRGEWFDFTGLGDPVAVVTAAVERIKKAEGQ